MSHFGVAMRNAKKRRMPHPIDIAISVDYKNLEAVEQDLGTCWVEAFHENQVKEILGVPHKIRVVVMLTLGYQAESPSARPRKKVKK